MVNIFSIKINSFMNSKLINYFLELVSEEKREKFKKYRFQEDALRSLSGDLLSRYAIIKKTGYKNSNLQFTVNSYNKPMLKRPDTIKFNVSHSGDWAVCAVSEDVVGIDVELIRPIEFEIAERFFSDSEYKSLMNQNPDKQLKYFYTLWTLKESYIKADGKGLSIPLNSFSLDICNDNQISLVTNNELSCCHFKCFKLDEQHVTSVCSLTNNIADNIKEVYIEDLLETVK